MLSKPGSRRSPHLQAQYSVPASELSAIRLIYLRVFDVRSDAL